jgi:hypothetical protein
MSKAMLIVFLCIIASSINSASAMTYRELANICYQNRAKISMSDCAACSSDAMRYCSRIGAPFSLNRVARCLYENRNRLTASCKRVLQKHYKSD